MSLSDSEIRRLFPYASKSTLARNRDADNQTPSPKPKRAIRDDALGKASRESSHAGRVVVRIVSFRRRLLDRDNLFGGSKYFTDGLRYAGLLSDDAEAQICLEVSQQKVATKEEEHTRIEIEPLHPKPQVPASTMTRPELIVLGSVLPVMEPASVRRLHGHHIER